LRNPGKATVSKQTQALLIEVDVEVCHPVESRMIGLQCMLQLVAEKLLTEVRRVADYRVESALGLG